MYQIRPVIDRVGAGDAFAAGLIESLLSDPTDLPGALEFGVAASCLKHSIPGDFNVVSPAEVEAIVAGSTAGRVSRWGRQRSKAASRSCKPSSMPHPAVAFGQGP
jgi:2-dehydro-3-deoxygluconokinase